MLVQDQKGGITIHCVSLGCPKNMVDTETMLGYLCREGFRPVVRPEEAEVILINTCAFIDEAKEESIETILEAVKYKDTGRLKWLVVSGCLSQLHGRDLQGLLPEVDLMLGTGDLFDVAQRLRDLIEGRTGGALLGQPGYLPEEPAPRVLGRHTTWAYLKIAEGCSHGCSFCTIPRARGPYRSRTVDSVVKEAQALLKSGIQELILVAQDTTAFGMDRDPNGQISQLLEALDTLEGIRWIRLLYAHPAHISEELLSTLPTISHLCPYLDIPIQHIDGRILERMGRRTAPEMIRQVVSRVREAVPGIFLRTSVIVGFPGEGEREFQALMDFLQEARFDWLGVFAFSPQEGTPAYRMPGRPPKGVIEKRMERVMEVQKEITHQRLKDCVGQVHWVLVEGKAMGKEGLYWGRTAFQAPDVDGVTYIRGSVRPGGFFPVHVEAVQGYDLQGRPLVWDHAGNGAPASLPHDEVKSKKG